MHVKQILVSSDRKLTSVRGLAGPKTPVVLEVNSRCLACAAPPPAARWKAQLRLRSRIFMAFSRGLESPLILLFILHMIHIV